MQKAKIDTLKNGCNIDEKIDADSLSSRVATVETAATVETVATVYTVAIVKSVQISEKGLQKYRGPGTGRR